jgi:hypothetical protein
MKKLLLLLIFSMASFTAVFAQQEQSGEEDWTQRLKTERLEVGLLLQSTGVFSFQDNNFIGGRRFELGATRLDIRGQLESNFVYRLQLDFRRAPSVLDAQVGYRFSDQFQLVAGAFKPYLSADLDPSPGDTDFINRARLVGAMMKSREIGITALGNSGQFNYRFGMYNGFGLQTANDNRFMYTVRLGYTAETEDGIFDFGVNAALNSSINEQVGNTTIVSMGDRTLYGGFLKYEGDAWFGTVELLQSKFDRLGFNEEETITGFYTTLGNNLNEKDQILARWDYLSFDLQDNSSSRIIFGWNHQATTIISFQLNLIGQFGENQDDQFGLAGNFQFQF